LRAVRPHQPDLLGSYDHRDAYPGDGGYRAEDRDHQFDESGYVHDRTSPALARQQLTYCTLLSQNAAFVADVQARFVVPSNQGAAGVGGPLGGTGWVSR
jgi:hypothetical protein